MAPGGAFRQIVRGVHTSFRTSSGVLHRSTSICIVCLSDLKSSSAFQLARYSCARSSLVNSPRVQQGRGDDQGPDPEARLLDPDAALADGQGLGQRVVGLPVDRPRLRRLGPPDDVVALAQPLARGGSRPCGAT